MFALLGGWKKLVVGNGIIEDTDRSRNLTPALDSASVESLTLVSRGGCNLTVTLRFT